MYKVTVSFPSSIKAVERRRAGVVITRADGYVGELTDEQLEAIKADQYLTVVSASKEPASTEAGSKAEEERATPPQPKQVAKK